MGPRVSLDPVTRRQIATFPWKKSPVVQFVASILLNYTTTKLAEACWKQIRLERSWHLLEYRQGKLHKDWIDYLQETQFVERGAIIFFSYFMTKI
jgi:hypothetical protein